MKTILTALRWVVSQVWDKINFVAVYRELKELGKKHGRRFFWAALIWELIEDGLFPLISWIMGVPELIPLFLILHFEPIGYPIIFWCFRTYDRIRGREPWEPERGTSSASWRSAVKVLVYKISICGWFAAILLRLDVALSVLVLYVVLMAAFGFIHERIWNDIGFGIRDDDKVEMKRVWSKAITYRIVSAMTMYPLLKACLSEVPWMALLGCQVVGFVLYFVLEALWSQTVWGLIQQQKETKEV
jgi:hypothetical protein